MVGSWVKKALWFFLVGSVVFAVFRVVPADVNGALDWFGQTAAGFKEWATGTVEEIPLDEVPTPDSIIPTVDPTVPAEG